MEKEKNEKIDEEKEKDESKTQIEFEQQMKEIYIIY